MKKYSYGLAFIAILFSFISITMVYSAAILNEQLSFTTVKKQITYIVIAFIIMIIVSFIDYHKYEKYTYVIYLITLVVLSLTLTGLGHSTKGAQRWIRFGGLNFQPSEFAKIAVIIYLSHSLSKKNIKLIKQFYIGVLPHMIFTGIVILLILVEPDFGTSSIISMLLLTMMIIAGVKWRDVLLPFIFLSVAGYFLIMGSNYRSARLKAFLNPWEHRSNISYQLIESMLAFSSGGITGKGLGNSIQKQYYLPEAHTDFIAAVIGEELGFVGIVSLMLLYCILFYIIIRIALGADSLFGTYVAISIGILFFTQAMLNLGVVSGGFPTKGLTLPFISFGGSSIVASMIMIGIVLNISKNASYNKGDRPNIKERKI